MINSAGAWGSQVGKLLGAPIDVINERHEAYTFELPSTVTCTMPMVMDYVPGTDAEGLYFRHEGERQLIGGLHTVDVPDADHVTDPNASFDGATQAGIEAIVERVDEALPTLDGLAFRGGWAGLYPHSPTGLPVVGPHPENADVIVASGLGGTGVNLAPALARVVADWMVHGEPRTIDGAEALAPRA